MKRLIVDMDDVLADATGQFLKFYQKEFGVLVPREALNYKNELEGFPDHCKVVSSFPYRKDFFRTMEANENSQEVMKKINQRYEVFVVSSAMQFPNSLTEKLEWLNERFPFLHWKQFVFCGMKNIVHGDYMIDDHAHNLETFNGTRLLYTAPHNMQFNHYQRVNNWKEISDLFLQGREI